jgi:Putative MetA-pathway of phenol degradation
MRTFLFSSVVVLAASAAFAQQRPLVTEDPETIGAGRLLLEGGVEYARDAVYPVSGLRGNLWRLPLVGISVGVSSIAEIQIDQASFSHLEITSRRPGPLTGLVTATGSSTTDTDDLLIGAKIRITPEGTRRPAFGFRFATKLPNANNESGLGLDTTDFFASVLAGKTTESVRIVGNIGFGILGDPTNGNRQNDVLTYGLSFARAITNAVEVVGEVNGRANTRSAGPLPGTESRSIVRMGLRYTTSGWRADGAVLIGATDNDPGIGFTAGFTYAFTAFQVP